LKGLKNRTRLSFEQFDCFRARYDSEVRTFNEKATRDEFDATIRLQSPTEINLETASIILQRLGRIPKIEHDFSTQVGFLAAQGSLDFDITPHGGVDRRHDGIHLSGHHQSRHSSWPGLIEGGAPQADGPFFVRRHSRLKISNDREKILLNDLIDRLQGVGAINLEYPGFQRDSLTRISKRRPDRDKNQDEPEEERDMRHHGAPFLIEVNYKVHAAHERLVHPGLKPKACLLDH
jgi:hypothetical protein